MNAETLRIVVKNASREALNAFDHGELNVPLGSRARGGSIDSQIDSSKLREEKRKKQEAKDNAEKTRKEKSEARELERYIKIIAETMAKKNGEKFNKSAVTSTLDSMMKWEPRKYIDFVKKFKSENGA